MTSVVQVCSQLRFALFIAYSMSIVSCVDGCSRWAESPTQRVGGVAEEERMWVRRGLSLKEESESVNLQSAIVVGSVSHSDCGLFQGRAVTSSSSSSSSSSW